MNIMYLIEAERNIIYEVLTHPTDETIDNLKEVQEVILKECGDIKNEMDRTTI